MREMRAARESRVIDCFIIDGSNVIRRGRLVAAFGCFSADSLPPTPTLGTLVSPAYIGLGEALKRASYYSFTKIADVKAPDVDLLSRPAARTVYIYIPSTACRILILLLSLVLQKSLSYIWLYTLRKSSADSPRKSTTHLLQVVTCLSATSDITRHRNPQKGALGYVPSQFSQFLRLPRFLIFKLLLLFVLFSLFSSSLPLLDRVSSVPCSMFRRCRRRRHHLFHSAFIRRRYNHISSLCQVFKLWKFHRLARCLWCSTCGGLEFMSSSWNLRLQAFDFAAVFEGGVSIGYTLIAKTRPVPSERLSYDYIFLCARRLQ